MKKILALLVAFAFCVSLCACGAKVEPTESAEDKIRSEVQAELTVEIMFSYDTVGVPQITYNIRKVNEEKYEVSGKVTVKDKYGDSYTGKYDAVVSYDPDTDDYETVNLDLGKLYKD